MKVRFLALLVAALFGVLAIALACVRAQAMGVKPLWTEADLPPLPPAGENGWARLAADGVSGPELSEELVDLARDGPWEKVETKQDAIATATANPRFSEPMAAFERAVSMRRFVDSSEPFSTARGPQMPVFLLTRAATLWGKYRAIQGDCSGAWGLTVDMLRSSGDLLVNSRSFLTTMVSLGCHRSAVALADTLLSKCGPPGDPALLIEALTHPAEREVNLEHTVIGEYLLMVKGLEMAGSERGAFLLFSRSRTLQLAQPYYQSLIAFARNGGEPPDQMSFSHGVLGLIDDPVGRKALDLMSGPVPNLLRRYQKDRRELLDAKASLRRRLQ